MNETKLPPLEYQQLARAARLLDCEVEDLLHWAETGTIQLCVRLNEKVRLCSFDFKGDEEEFARLLLEEEKQAKVLSGEPFCLPSHPLSKISIWNLIEEKLYVEQISGMKSVLGKLGGNCYCKCNVKGLWAFPNNAHDFATLQTDGKLCLKGSCSFLPADYSTENPPKYRAQLFFDANDPNKTVLTVSVEDLWITRAQMEKIQNFQEQPLSTSDNPRGATEFNAGSRAHVSDKLAILNQAALKFWGNADPDDRGTHTNNEKVAAWLGEHGFTPTLASKGATIIRPKWAPTGRKPEE